MAYAEHFLPHSIGIELIYSFTIIICSLMVYFGTKELYELSLHKGIKYFRLAFLFFALSYLLRYFARFLLVIFDVRGIIEIRIIGALILLVLIYLSIMAVFYLLYSVMWKRWADHPKRIYLLHIAAALISIITIVSRERELLFGLNIMILAIVAFAVYIAYKDSKKKNQNLYIVYLLLFIFWILNIIDILIPDFLRIFQLVIYLASIFLFLLILYKVLKKSSTG